MGWGRGGKGGGGGPKTDQCLVRGRTTDGSCKRAEQQLACGLNRGLNR